MPLFRRRSDDAQAAAQRPAAVAAMSNRVFVPVTVLLEFEWVLRGFYKLPRNDIVSVLRALAGIEHVPVEDRGAAFSAIDACEVGLDFADALHLTRSGRCAAFISFDRRLAERGKVLELKPIVEMLA